MDRPRQRRHSVLRRQEARGNGAVAKALIRAGLGALVQSTKGVPTKKIVVGALSGLIEEVAAGIQDQKERSRKTITVPYEVIPDDPKKK